MFYSPIFMLMVLVIAAAVLYLVFTYWFSHRAPP